MIVIVEIARKLYDRQTGKHNNPRYGLSFLGADHGGVHAVGCDVLEAIAVADGCAVDDKTLIVVGKANCERAVAFEQRLRNSCQPDVALLVKSHGMAVYE